MTIQDQQAEQAGQVDSALLISATCLSVYRAATPKPVKAEGTPTSNPRPSECVYVCVCAHDLLLLSYCVHTLK